MKKEDWRILIVDDHDAMRDGLELLMRRRGHKTMSAPDGRQGLQLLEEQGADLVVTDLKMGRISGLDVLVQAKELAPETDVLVITAHGTVEKAVEAMKQGACDFITKPFSSEEFGIKVDRILRERSERLRLLRENVALRAENTYLRNETGELYGEMIGKSEGMKTVRRFVDRAAATDSTVMVYGESGTGKELVARALHAGSHRRDGPFVRVNCGALPESLLETELFGHEKGAFTGADRQRRGRFELADGGTLFLDEISTVSAATQVRLLRVIQERELERVGGAEQTISVDVRIVAATNTPADELQSGKDFRRDLFYRLHVVPVTLPPLRERRDDIPLLVEHFVAKLRARTRSAVTAVEPGAMSRLQKYRWPGNIRELENVVERALVLADGEVLREEHLPLLPERVGSGATGGFAAPSLPASGGLELNRVLDRIEEDLVREALQQAGGVKAAAARLLSIKKSALHYKINKYGIEP